MSADTPALPRLLRLREVRALVGLSHDAIYRLAREGRFPPPRKLSDRASAWREDEIRAWIESRPVSGGSAERAARADGGALR